MRQTTLYTHIIQNELLEFSMFAGTKTQDLALPVLRASTGLNSAPNSTVLILTATRTPIRVIYFNCKNNNRLD